MEENNVMTKEQLQEDYSNVYVKKVHLIGRATMAIAFILMFAPVLYMHFVAGFTAPADAYMACAAAACAAGVGGWIAEPISYFPILGAAGTYMSYLAGNVGNTRVPVAVAVQSATDSDKSQGTDGNGYRCGHVHFLQSDCADSDYIGGIGHASGGAGTGA